MLVAFLDSAFDAEAAGESETYAALQAAAARAGLCAEKSPSSGRILWAAPDSSRRRSSIRSFELMNYGQLRAQVNGTIQLCAMTFLC